MNLENEIYYQYYDMTAIKKSLKFMPKQLRDGQAILEAGGVTIEALTPTYPLPEKKPIAKISAKVKDLERPTSKEVSLYMDQMTMNSSFCECRGYYSNGHDVCEHIAAVCIWVENYLKTNRINDATDYGGELLLDAFQNRDFEGVLEETTEKKYIDEHLSLLPKLIKKEDKLQLAFRVGTDKLYVIKNLSEFCDRVKAGEVGTYGNKTQILHKYSSFTRKSKQWIQFLYKVQTEDALEQKRNNEHSYDSYQSVMGAQMPLSGWRLDLLFKELEGSQIEFDDRDLWEKKKAKLSFVEEAPKGSLFIKSMEKEADGIEVSAHLPVLYHGAEALYYLHEDKFCRVPQKQKEVVGLLAPLIQSDGSLKFQVGRQRMTDFYYRVLPKLATCFQITEEDPEKSRAYLPPKAQYAFYLDADEESVSCEVYALYGEERYNLCDHQTNQVSLMVQRDIADEMTVLSHVNRWFPNQNIEEGRFYLDGSEDLDRTLQALDLAGDDLLDYGEVHVTENYRRRQQIRKVKLSVGVSISGDLLELDIIGEELSQVELLEAFKQYRAKKHYYKLRNGNYIHLDDSSMEMMDELFSVTRMSDKEFLKGNLSIPLYRTLYLEQLLEEHSEVYQTRDQHFKEIVKGFKTVKDSNFEVPPALKKTLRNYQKHGYRWLRTLETYGFGGILADDMGLGKTLQMITVLSAAKEEGRLGMSLIVTPASLVYNWGEELRRFAPELKTVLVSGSQKERQEILASIETDGADIVVASYDLLKRDIADYENLSFHYQVIDEAQYIKNHTTAVAKAVKVVKSKVRYALTGTPIENRLSELWSIFDYLMPGFLYGYDAFRRDVEIPIVKKEDEEAMLRLKRLASPFILRRLKEDVLKDLPEKLEENRFVSFEPEQRQLYDAQLAHMKAMLLKQDASEFQKNKLQILSELTKLRQICCDPSLCFDNYQGEAAKKDALMELLHSAIDGGHKILLFSQFTSMLDIIRMELAKAGIPFYVISGATKKEERLALVQKFNEGEVPVFLISLKAGGVGLNLIGADMVIHYDPWWNIAAQNQATDRAHRIGQQRKVTVYKLIVKGTIEEKILELQEKKQKLSDQVIGGEGGQLAAMSKDELLALLEA